MNPREKAMLIFNRLVEIYSYREWKPRFPPIDELVLTILSQNTSDVNAFRAFRNLKAKCSTWYEVLNLSDDELYNIIKFGGLGKIKSKRIKYVLSEIISRVGKLDLNFLKDLPPEKAREWLVSIKGIGFKTASIVLQFSLGIPAIPVDTHVFRVSSRLGLIPPKTTREKAHIILESLFDTKDYYTIHLNLISHGRKICHARSPLCDKCKLNDLCDFFNTS